MPSLNLKIQWKGYPHRRFPRIRFASRSRTSSNHSLAHAAAHNGLRQPLGKALAQERLKQRFRIGRRRLQSSQISSATVRARKRAILRAQQHIQVFGWDTPQADAASRTSKVTLPAEKFEPSPAKPRFIPPLRSTLGHAATQSTVVDSNDGAATSVARKVKPNAPANPYSLMHVAEEPFEWKSTTAYNQTRPSDQFITPPARPSDKEYVHVRRLNTVSRGRCLYPHSPQDIRRGRTYDRRIDPKNRVNAGVWAKSAPAHSKIPVNTQQSKEKKVSEASFNPTFRKPVESYKSISKETRASVQSLKSVIHTILSSGSSRPPSQKRALKHFTKELELYLQATQCLPKKSLIASRSATTVSANTVEDLKPFQAEFRAAGLAVTSEEQRRKSFIMPRFKKPVATPETPPKRDRWDSKATDAPNHRHRRKSSVPSDSSGTMVMGWTPPHEAALRQQQKTSRRTSYTWSSNHTVMAFTPPHERETPQKQSLPPASKSLARKSLPWLRQPATPPSSPPSPTTRIEAQPSTKPAEPNSPLPEEMPTSLITNIPPTALEQNEEPFGRQRLKRRSEVKWNDTTYVFQERSGDRSPVSPSKSQYVEQATQTDTLPESLGVGQSFTITEMSSPEPNVKSVEGMQSCLFTSRPRGGSIPYRPFLASMALRSSQQSSVPFSEAPELSMVFSPTREAPSPPMESTNLPNPEPTLMPGKSGELALDPDMRATSLRRYIEAGTKVPSPEPGSVPEKEMSLQKPEMISAPEPGAERLHQCTGRSLECEQCSSQMEGSPFLSPPDRYVAQEQSSKPEGGSSTRDKCCHTSVERRMPDPIKRPPVSKARLLHTPQAHLHSKHTHAKCSSPLPPIPTIPYLDQVPESGTNYDTCTSTETPRPGRILDKQVFRGLHVATAAACDEDVDKWIEEVMGSGVRRFLADLSAFDGLGINSLTIIARRAAEQKRYQLRAWERIREQRMEERADDREAKAEIETPQGKSMDRKNGLSAGDKSVTLRSLRELDDEEAKD